MTLPPGALFDAETHDKFFTTKWGDPKHWHEATHIRPTMSEAEIDELAEDIRLRGLLYPVAMFQDKVLDGRNRLMACERARITPTFTPVSPKSPLRFVVQANLLRTDPTPSQKAALAVQLLPRFQAEAEERQKTAGKHGAEGGRGHKKEKPSAQKEAKAFGKAAKLAGLAFKVSTGYVELAFKISKDKPELIEKMVNGELNIKQAERIARSNGSLAVRFGAPPRTVLDAKQKYWTDRKVQWYSLGVSGGHNEQVNSDEGSEFDPVLAEIIYRWFAPMKGGHILDPFAGEAIRGLVAAWLGFDYTGIEVREKQVATNMAQATELRLRKSEMLLPEWVHGNAETLDELLPAGKMYDLLCTSPPYWKLEVYEKDDRNLSAVGYQEFLVRYKKIFRLAVDRLKHNRFAVIKVGDIRDDGGFYVNLVGDTVKCFLDLGLKLYNWAILTTQLGDPRQQNYDPFRKARKLGNRGHAHQHVLCFFKGDDTSVITQEFGILDEENLSKK